MSMVPDSYQEPKPRLITKQLLWRGTNGRDSYTPIEGGTQAPIPLSPALKFLVAALTLSSIGLALSLIVSGWSIANPPVVGALAVAAIAAERSRVDLGQRLHISITW